MVTIQYSKLLFTVVPGIVEQFTCLFITHNFKLAGLVLKIDPATNK